MMTCTFDAVLDQQEKERNFRCVVRFAEKDYAAEMSRFPQKREEGEQPAFYFVRSSQPIPLVWKHPFIYTKEKESGAAGKATVLFPGANRVTGKKEMARRGMLFLLSEGVEEMVRAVVDEAGIQGIIQERLVDFSGLSVQDLTERSVLLESKGHLRILSFSPLFFLSQTSFENLCSKIVQHLTRFHEGHPTLMGLNKKKIRQRFDVHPRILTLALKNLVRAQMIREGDEYIALADFQIHLSLSDEKVLAHLEDIYLEGHFQSESLESLRRKLNVAPHKLDQLISLLIERERVVQSKDGYILHADWLDDLVAKLKSLEKRELTVSEFKDMTGLTRKYAIPLLELLDQMNITRRRGSVREIVSEGERGK
ncbi:MAG: SelB C-terminal domain-containing protein [Acidobacteria bacterium]|nr:SelB C-terminal domain-containing protein [Acidobacteriota bacterium]MBU1338083.1 SelB C-terminal domain-containing protein [Acidobacteriota bacterium]MBU1474265.1 SelB C-terminal domain-containing protein [Acidobacteriota bacterium]